MDFPRNFTPAPAPYQQDALICISQSHHQQISQLGTNTFEIGFFQEASVN
jgi:hypothetical protein